jgi:dolichyl-phosphate-mannose--protein O-mannosyl transferase
MKRRGFRLGIPWQMVAVAVVALVSVIALFTLQLGSLAPRLSPSEQQAVSSSRQLLFIAHDPLNAPQKLLTFGALHLPNLPETYRARLPSAFLGLIAVTLMVYVLRTWYGRRSAVLGFLLFAASAWTLHVSRFAGTDITYLAAMLAILAAYIDLHEHQPQVAAWFRWLFVTILVLFVPGLIWFVLIGLIWQHRAILASWQELGFWQRALSVALLLGALGALAQAFVVDHSLLPAWLGVPAHSSLETLTSLPRQLLATLSAIAWRAPVRPELWLGNVPLLNDFLLVMFVAGTAFYARHRQAARTQLLAGYLLVGVALVSLGVVSLSVLVPLLYIVAMAGIAYVLHFWLQVFPRNPIARSFGLTLIAALVGLTCYFGLVQYFVAWPHNPAVQQVYQIRH